MPREALVNCPGSWAGTKRENDPFRNSRGASPLTRVLSRDLHSSGHDLHFAVLHGARQSALQIGLPGIDPPPFPVNRHRVPAKDDQAPTEIAVVRDRAGRGMGQCTSTSVSIWGVPTSRSRGQPEAIHQQLEARTDRLFKRTMPRVGRGSKDSRHTGN